MPYRQRTFIKRGCLAPLRLCLWLWAEHPLWLLGAMALVAAGVWWAALR